MMRIMILLAAVAVAGWPERAQACSGDGTAASCLRAERECMESLFGMFRSCDFSCGDCPVRPPQWTPGPPNTAPMSEFLPAVGDTIAAIPGAVAAGLRQVGNDVMACVTDPFGSLACVRVGVVVGGTVCSIASAGTCAPLVMGAGVLMSLQSCISSCGGQPANLEACKQACAGTVAAGGTALVGVRTGAFSSRPPMYPGGQLSLPNPLNLMPPPALAGGPAVALAPPIAVAIPAVPALAPGIAAAPMLMSAPPDGMGDPNDYRGPGPYRDKFTNPDKQGELEAEHVPSKALTEQQAPGVNPQPVGMGPWFSNRLKGAETKRIMEAWRAYEQWVRDMALSQAEKERLIEEFWAHARQEDWNNHNGGGAIPVDPDELDLFPAPGS